LKDMRKLFRKAIEGALKELEEKDKIREIVIRRTREANRLIREAVFLTHSGNLEQAKDNLAKARSQLNELCDIARRFPDIAYGGIMGMSFQEYTEAYALIKLIEEQRIPSYEELNVPLPYYLTGLADLLGELRRRILDLLRSGDLEGAERTFSAMESLYLILREISYPEALIPGLRHKCDRGRQLVEITRSHIVEAKMKAELVNSVKKALHTLKGRSTDNHEDIWSRG